MKNEKIKKSNIPKNTKLTQTLIQILISIKKIKYLEWEKISEFTEKFDWIFACPTETSIGLKFREMEIITRERVNEGY